MLYLCVVILEVGVCMRRYETEYIFSYSFSLQYHEKCGYDDDEPLSYSSPYLTHHSYTSRCERWYLCSEEGLDITSILPDDIESMIEITSAKKKKYHPFYKGVKLKSLDPLCEICLLCIICPCSDCSYSITDIVYNYRYECPYDDTPEQWDYDKHSDERDPYRDFILFSEIHERIDDDREKSWYNQYEKNISKGIYHKTEKCYPECDKYFLCPESEVEIHRKK